MKRRKSSLEDRIVADRQRRAAIERARLDEILSEFPAPDDLAREILRLRRNERQVLDALLMSKNGEHFIVMGPGPIGAHKYKIGCCVSDDYEKAKQLF
jgi:hypothetical protein